jgi:hypothetical protein
MSTKLLEKESDAGRLTLIPQVAKPARIRRAASRLAFAARDKPVDPRQIQVR